jgi:AraC-like DNA-binding protein
MKPQLIKVAVQPPMTSFNARAEAHPNINNRWHFHPEVELIQIHAGSGMQFVGDNMRPFQAGDVVLVGSNLPHYWRFDDYPSPENTVSYSTVIHFLENVWGDHFLNLPETRHLKNVLQKSKQGILITGADATHIGTLISRVYQSDGLRKLIALIETLSAIYECNHQTVLSSIGFKYSYSDAEDERIHNIYEYTLQHAAERIELSTIAGIAGLAENSFCRYFKLRTGKTYSNFLAEIRIGRACKLLIEDKLSIKQVSYSSGFNNFSCFFQKFKKITGKTPLQYKQEIL